jgi:hypothetical protein
MYFYECAPHLRLEKVLYLHQDQKRSGAIRFLMDFLRLLDLGGGFPCDLRTAISEAKWPVSV